MVWVFFMCFCVCVFKVCMAFMGFMVCVFMVCALWCVAFLRSGCLLWFWWIFEWFDFRNGLSLFLYGLGINLLWFGCASLWFGYIFIRVWVGE